MTWIVKYKAITDKDTDNDDLEFYPEETAPVSKKSKKDKDADKVKSSIDKQLEELKRINAKDS